MNEANIMHTILINSLFVVIAIGFVAYIIEKKTRIKILTDEIEAEPIKYTSTTFNCSSYSEEFIGRLILLALIGVIISVPVLYFMNNPYYGIMSLIIIILFLALINFSPYYITIENGKIYYRHLIDTLNKTIVIPLAKVDRITYWEETVIKKVLSLNINEGICIDINVLLMSNYEEIYTALNQYIENRDNVVIPDNIRYKYSYSNNKDSYIPKYNGRIKVKRSSDYILLMILLISIESVTVFSFLFGYHDIITIIAMVIIPLIMLKLIPYKICFYNDRIEYRHILHTHGKTEIIFTNDISHIEIISKMSHFVSHSEHRLRHIRMKHYTLNIYKNDKDIISLNLLYENMGDIQQIARIINSRSIDN